MFTAKRTEFIRKLFCFLFRYEFWRLYRVHQQFEFRQFEFPADNMNRFIDLKIHAEIVQ